MYTSCLQAGHYDAVRSAMPSGVFHPECLLREETQRVVGNDWVVRYENRALQILPTARAKRHTGPKARILVRETRALLSRPQPADDSPNYTYQTTVVRTGDLH